MINDSQQEFSMKRIGSGFTMMVLFLIAGCTTVQTQKLVLSEPMNSDLEGRVMRETGISGAVVGGLAGGAGAGGLAFVTAVATGSSAENAGIAAAIAGGSGALVGGVVGAQEGRKKGEKIVAQALSRDQIQNYIQGAKAYNQRIAQDNESIKSQINQIAQNSDVKSRKPQYYKLKVVTEGEMKTVDNRINERQKALSQLDWDSADKGQYAAELNSLKIERKKLQSTYQQIVESTSAASTM